MGKTSPEIERRWLAWPALDGLLEGGVEEHDVAPRIAAGQLRNAFVIGSTQEAGSGRRRCWRPPLV